MRQIELDASSWTTVLDFYAALLAALGAPNWHGMNINALIDSMIWGGINAVEPPYTVRIREIAKLSKDIVGEVELAKRALSEARAEFRRSRGHDVEVLLETAA
ncbi:MAG TPA: barstar family protein [Micropepsaceae bacterium]|nr:barstar family protein [Micropepsaceae bacterium]